MTRFAIALALGIVLCGMAPGAVGSADAPAPGKPTIEDLDVLPADGAYRVSFRVTGAFPAEVVELIESGAEVSFRHRVDLVSKRGFFGSRSLSRCVVTTTVTYDSLIRQYHLSRVVEFEPSPGADLPIPEARDTDDVDEVRKWMTEIRDIRVPFSTDEGAPRPRKVKVQTNLGRRFVLLLFPASRGATAEFPLDS